MAILEVTNLKKSFGKTEVLKDISFSLEKGQVLAIIGSSGSGKTTLLRCLNFLETPDAGEISVNGKPLLNLGQPLTDEQIRTNRLHFGLVFQNFNLFPQYSVLENITLAPTLLKTGTPQQIQQQALGLLEQVGLSDKLEAYPYQLSGGQQQRVAIARALAAKPAIILADEPTGNLDSKTSQDVMSLLKVTSQKFSQTIVMITHNEEIAQMADRIIRIEDGKIVTRS